MTERLFLGIKDPPKMPGVEQKNLVSLRWQYSIEKDGVGARLVFFFDGSEFTSRVIDCPLGEEITKNQLLCLLKDLVNVFELDLPTIRKTTYILQKEKYQEMEDKCAKYDRIFGTKEKNEEESKNV